MHCFYEHLLFSVCANFFNLITIIELLEDHVINTLSISTLSTVRTTFQSEVIRPYRQKKYIDPLQIKEDKVNIDTSWNQFLMAFSVVTDTYHFFKSIWKKN